MDSNIEQIRKICYQKGAIDAINEMNILIKDLLEILELDGVTIDITERISCIYRKYSQTNLLSDNELDEAQQKSE